MRRRTPPPPSPLPQLNGVDPVRVRLPAAGGWATVRDHLVARLAAGDGVIDGMLDAGRIVDATGRPVARDTAYAPGMYVWFHRELADEERVPFPIEVVHRDEHIVVADKPHFLATTPRGSHVAETALARLRRDLGLPALGAAHRLDRLTAGLVLFSTRPGTRDAYQRLFRERRIVKTYEAIAPALPGQAFPLERHSRLVPGEPFFRMAEVPGEPNARTRIEVIDGEGPWWRYRLDPETGRKHQLRVHMAALGAPIRGDDLYPELNTAGQGDATPALQLLAKALAFEDPLTGESRQFRSQLALGR